jgi:hypothetical protein
MGRVVAAAVYSAGKKVTNITLDEGAAWAAKPGHFVWIGLEEPNEEELYNLQRQFNLHELAIEDALENTAGRNWKPSAMPCSSSFIPPSWRTANSSSSRPISLPARATSSLRATALGVLRPCPPAV